MAKRSATESASILDILLHLKLIEEKVFARAREFLARIVAMLIKLVQSLGEMTFAQRS